MAPVFKLTRGDS